MASYHLSVKTGGKGSASPHADYIAREGKYTREKDSDLEHKESGNMPAWAAHKPSEFWKAADTSERANGCTYREIEIALPRELKPEQRLELVRDFVRQEIGERHAYQVAIHNPKA
ncbi:mobilization protein MobA, partial [Klebsiella pneumoniae]